MDVPYVVLVYVAPHTAQHTGVCGALVAGWQEEEMVA